MDDATNESMGIDVECFKSPPNAHDDKAVLDLRY